MGYLSDAYRDFKWFEKMRKEANVGKRDFKQIEKIHRKNKMKKKEENDMGEPTYWEQLIIIAMLLASPIEHQAKEDLIKKFCKKFNKTEEELLRDLKGE